MPRDNEKIISILSDSTQFLRSQLIELVQSDPNPEVLRCFFDGMSMISQAVNNMSDRENLYGHGLHPVGARLISSEPLAPDGLLEGLALLEKKICLLTEKVDLLTGGGHENP
jgi:hypothetical protein